MQSLAVIAFAYEMELSAKPHAGKQPRGIGQINRHGTSKLACRQQEERRWTTLAHRGTGRETVTTRRTVSDTKCAAKEAAGQRFLVLKKKTNNKRLRSVVSSACLFSPMVQVVERPLLRCCGQFSFQGVIMQCERERFICNDSLAHEYSQSKQR